MVNRVLLFGAGAILTGGLVAFAYVHQSEARLNPETVVTLDADPGADENQVALMKLPTPVTGTVLYACPDGRAFAMSYGAEDGTAALTLDGETTNLKPVKADAGTQYSDGFVTVHAEGELAAVLIGDQSAHDNCRVVHEASYQLNASAPKE